MTHALDEKFNSFLPNERIRWETLRKQLLLTAELEQYNARMRINSDPVSRWSSDEAFACYLLDCIQEDLSHGEKITEDDDAEPDSSLIGIIFPHQAARWERLRDRMLSIPYMDRYISRNPKWSGDELFTCCLLDRLEEQVKNLELEAKNNGENDASDGYDNMSEDDSNNGDDDDDDDDNDDSASIVDGQSDPGSSPAHHKPENSTKIESPNSSESDEWVEDDKQNFLRPKVKIFQCKFCKKLLKTGTKAVRHFVRRHESRKQPELTTSSLTPGKTKTGELDKKKQAKSPRLIAEDLATPLFYCKICQRYVDDLPLHQRDHPDILCDICGKKFQLKRFLQKHMKVHTQTAEEKRCLLCDYCGKRYSCRISLAVHLQVHGGKKLRRYPCDVCGKNFVTKDKLYIHTRIHRNEKPFECETCGRRFTQKYNMKKHMRIHTGVKPYECDLCGESFNHKVSLKNHKKKVHMIDWWQKDVLPVVPDKI